MRDATYWAEILFSAGIATLGLILNSPAVIIGAMLISPLMNPIMAGLALAAGDFILAMRALMNLASSSAAAVAFSTLLVTLLPFREMTAEIASRTHPNTLDLVIALFSGTVGALAVCKSFRGVVPTSLPGVAIAVALMPPLCVTGYGIGVFLTVDRPQGLAILAGGGLLFVTNLVAITFSSMLVFRSAKTHRH